MNSPHLRDSTGQTGQGSIYRRTRKTPSNNLGYVDKWGSVPFVPFVPLPPTASPAEILQAIENAGISLEVRDGTLFAEARRHPPAWLDALISARWRELVPLILSRDSFPSIPGVTRRICCREHPKPNPLGQCPACSWEDDERYRAAARRALSTQALADEAETITKGAHDDFAD